MRGRQVRPAVKSPEVVWSSAADVPESAGIVGMEKGAVLDNGREVSSTLLMTQAIRVGCARLRAGIVGHVFTAEDQRGKGLAATLMRSALERMHQHGNHIAFLLGIPSFYQRFGYTTVAHYYATLLACRAAPTGAPGIPVRTYQDSDIDGVRAVASLDNRHRTGTLVRSRDAWLRGPVSKGLSTCCVAVTAGGRVCGYALYADPEQFYARLMAGADLAASLVVQEAGVRDAAAAEALLAHLHALAGSRARANILFLGPPDHLLSRAMYARGGQLRQAIVPDNGGAQARFVGFHDTFSALTREFTRRCRESRSLPRRASVAIGTEMGAVRIAWDGRAVRCTACSHDDVTMRSRDLVRCVFGFALHGQNGPHTSLLDTLFRAEHAHTWPYDEMI